MGPYAVHHLFILNTSISPDLIQIYGKTPLQHFNNIWKYSIGFFRFFWFFWLDNMSCHQARARSLSWGWGSLCFQIHFSYTLFGVNCILSAHNSKVFFGDGPDPTNPMLGTWVCHVFHLIYVQIFCYVYPKK